MDKHTQLFPDLEGKEDEELSERMELGSPDSV